MTCNGWHHSNYFLGCWVHSCMFALAKSVRWSFYHYPRVCGSEVLCLLSRSGWARFLRPVGTGHRVCALTDREQHTDNPLSTSARTAQPLSPEADPFVQGETLGDRSKGCRNDLEWRSRELAQAGSWFESGSAEVYEGPIFPSWTRFPGSSRAGHGLSVTVSSPGNPRQTESFANLFEPFALIIKSKTQNLIGLYADWQNKLIWQVICPNGEEKPGCFIINMRKQSVKVVCP